MPGIRKYLVFRIIHIFAKVKFKKDHIIDSNVNTKVLTTGLLKRNVHQQLHRPSGVNSY